MDIIGDVSYEILDSTTRCYRGVALVVFYSKKLRTHKCLAFPVLADNIIVGELGHSFEEALVNIKNNIDEVFDKMRPPEIPFDYSNC
jgi:hypothetical protein